LGLTGLGAGPEPGVSRPSSEDRSGAVAKGQMKSNKEARKPKKETPKTIAAKPSAKGSSKESGRD
jgi:hypothetical protein